MFGCCSLVVSVVVCGCVVVFLVWYCLLLYVVGCRCLLFIVVRGGPCSLFVCVVVRRLRLLYRCVLLVVCCLAF